MPDKTAGRPSAALLVSVLALVVALGGTAYAAGLAKNSVGAAQIKKDAVRSSDVKNGSLKAKDIAKGQLDPSVVVAATNQALVSISAAVNDPADTVIRTMDLPAGTHYVQATVYAINTSGAQQAEPRCYLRSSGTSVGGGTTGFYQPIQPDAGTNTDRAQFQLDGAFVLNAPGNVRVECNKDNAGQAVSAGASLSAIRVGSVTAP
jgi:hypothetical protein